MIDNEYKLVVLSNLVTEIFSELNLGTGTLTPAGLDNLRREIVKKIPGADIIFPKEFYQLYQILNKTGPPYTFNPIQSKWHGRLAITLYVLRNGKRFNAEEIKEAYANEGEEQWIIYYNQYVKDFLFKPVQLVNHIFWQLGADTDDKEILREFLNGETSESVPFLVDKKLIPELEIDREFFGISVNREYELNSSLINLLLDREKDKNIIKISSICHGEGKTVFIWGFIYKYWRQFNFILLRNLNFRLTDLPHMDDSIKSKTIIVVIDGKLNELEDNEMALSDAFRLVRERYRDYNITFIILDVEELFKKFNPLTNIGGFTNSIITIWNFKLSKNENDRILEFLFKEKSIPGKDIALVNYRFSEYGLPLFDRMSRLLAEGVENGQESYNWKNDAAVKSHKLKNLYFIVALLNRFGIKMPYDYTSEIFLSKTEPSEVLELFRNHTYLKRIINVSNGTDRSYPYISLRPSKFSTALNYINYNTTIKNDAKFFFNELIQVIKNRKANNAHSYVFRKIFNNKYAKSKNSPLADQLERISVLELLDLIVSSPLVDPENKEKVLGSKVSVLFHSGNYPEALDILDSFPNQENEFVKYHRARILFECGKTEECINEIANLPFRFNIANLRYRCFLRFGFLKQGLSYYMDNLSKLNTLTEFNFLIECVRKLSILEGEDNADIYLEKLQLFYATSYNIERLTNVIYERAHLHFIWGKSRVMEKNKFQAKGFKYFEGGYNINATDEKILSALALIEIGKKELNKEDISKFLFLEAKVLDFQGHYTQAINIILNFASTSPFNVKTNFDLAQMYYHRGTIDKRTALSDFNEAIIILERNKNIFEFKKTPALDSCMSYELLAKAFMTINIGESERLLKNYIDHHKISYVINSKTNGILSLYELIKTEIAKQKEDY